jgi:hypothetical protein
VVQETQFRPALIHATPGRASSGSGCGAASSAVGFALPHPALLSGRAPRPNGQGSRNGRGARQADVLLSVRIRSTARSHLTLGRVGPLRLHAGETVKQVTPDDVARDGCGPGGALSQAFVEGFSPSRRCGRWMRYTVHGPENRRIRPLVPVRLSRSSPVPD